MEEFKEFDFERKINKLDTINENAKLAIRLIAELKANGNIREKRIMKYAYILPKISKILGKL